MIATVCGYVQVLMRETVNIPGVFAHLYSAVLMLSIKTKVQISLFMKKTCVLMNLNVFFLHKKIFFGGKI